MRKCFLEGFGRCRGGISGEHYVSKNLLKSLGDGKSVVVGGLRWQEHRTLKSVGINSLVKNNLCRDHNASLSNLDLEAGKLFRAFYAANKAPSTLPPETAFYGKMIERWLIKVLCGFVGAAGFNKDEIPSEWKRLLVGGKWPAGWGLYLPPSDEVHVFAEEFAAVSYSDDKGEVGAVQFRIAGVNLHLYLGKPVDKGAAGLHRPDGIIFRYPDLPDKKVRLRWPKPTGGATIYTKIGETQAAPPQLKGWKPEGT